MKKITVPVIVLMTVLLCISAQAQTTSEQAVNYQINATHTGSINVPGLTPPLKQKWSINFGQAISYPVIAGGKVFVTVRNASAYGTKLYAIDGATGAVAWGPVELAGSYFWSALCYENGRVFTLSGNGALRAFDAANGNMIWSLMLPGQYSFDSAPTVYQGVVYTGGAGSGGTVYAVSAETGSVLWTSRVVGGSQSSPAVTDEGVYFSYSCPNVYKFNPADGALLWRYDPGCSGGGGKTPALYNGRLYVRDYTPNYIFDSGTGAKVGNFISKNIPAFSGNMSFILNGAQYYESYGTLEGWNLDGNTLAWSFAGDGYLQSAPLVVNEHVYIGSKTGKLYALEKATGQQVWSTNAGTGIPYVDEHNVSQPLTGFAAGEGLLVIPTKTTLVAYEGDHTAPTLTWGNQIPLVSASGWYNIPVYMYFTAADDLSGVASTDPADNFLTFNREGTNQTKQVTVTDKAGNSATFTSPSVNVDFTPPTTGAVLSNTGDSSAWSSGAVQVTLSASDGLSGLADTYYSVDGASPKIYSEPFSVSHSGEHYLIYWSTDVAGNIEGQLYATFKIDASAPTTQATISGVYGNGWYRDPAQVTLSASDSLSGVADSFYTVDGGEAQTYTTPFNVSGGSHVINYWSVDAVGNVEAQHALTVNVDADAPSTQLATAGTAGTNGWYRSSVQVSLTPTDIRSGVANTYYSVDGGATQAYTGTFTVSGDAQHSVSFWSVDRVGNTEARRSAAINIDATSPTRHSALVLGPPGNNSYFRGAVQMSLGTTDDLSGVASIYYRIDGGATQTYSGAFTISGDGVHPVEFWSVDVAGNNSNSNTSMIRIDATAPQTQAAASGTTGANGWYRSPVQVALSAADNLSGIANSYYSIDGGATQTYAGAFTVSNAGAHTILFWSQDQANNTEAQSSLSFAVDAGAPLINIAASPSSAPKRSTALNVTISGSITDMPSGVQPNSATYAVFDEYGVRQPTGSVFLQSNGSYSFTLSLPATRNNKDSDGHKYTITVRAADQAGNTGAASTVVTIL
jgi:outer membrane protein assembly factor BamB